VGRKRRRSQRYSDPLWDRPCLVGTVATDNAVLHRWTRALSGACVAITNARTHQYGRSSRMRWLKMCDHPLGNIGRNETSCSRDSLGKSRTPGRAWRVVALQGEHLIPAVKGGMILRDKPISRGADGCHRML
jgi:hypothetical protein